MPGVRGRDAPVRQSDESPPESDDDDSDLSALRKTDCRFGSSRLCLGQAETGPGFHLPLQ